MGFPIFQFFVFCRSVEYGAPGVIFVLRFLEDGQAPNFELFFFGTLKNATISVTNIDENALKSTEIYISVRKKYQGSSIFRRTNNPANSHPPQLFFCFFTFGSLLL
eukprot:GEMP01110643.1.p1 GENE.GEMP01110643.1~~GEMP01110643.1.p1  ORF type:complete len:106 (-),score=6.81 GEMP01110643.1:342-659(-)